MNKIGIGIVAGMVVLGLMVAGTYNGLVSLDVAVTGSWAQIENVLQRRADLIPNLVSSVKGFAKHEREILETLANARAKYAGAGTVSEKIKAAGELEGAIGRLLVVVENYPNLKANETFAKLMDELAGSENRIAMERKMYNEVVGAFNGAIRSFPKNMIAGWFGFIAKPFFEAQPDAKTVPQVDFTK